MNAKQSVSILLFVTGLLAIIFYIFNALITEGAILDIEYPIIGAFLIVANATIWKKTWT